MQENIDKVCYIGIDPGKAGFITIFEPGNGHRFIPMPTELIESGKILKSGKPQMKEVFSERGFLQLILGINSDYKGYKIYAAIEEVTGRAGWSAQNSFNFGLVAGLQRMILIMLNADYITVRPQKWQSFMRMGYPDLRKKSSTGKTMVRDPKAIAEAIVMKEYPNIDFRKTPRSKNNDDNKIDSFLICMYLYRIKNQ